MCIRDRSNGHANITKFKGEVTGNDTYTTVDGVPRSPLVKLWVNVVQQVAGLYGDVCYGEHSDDSKSVTRAMSDPMSETGSDVPTALEMQSMTLCHQNFEDRKGRSAVNLIFKEKQAGGGRPKQTIPVGTNFLHWQGSSLQSGTNHLVQPMDATRRDFVTYACLLYTSPSPRDLSTSRMPSSA